MVATARALELIAHERPGALEALAGIEGLGPRWVADGGQAIRGILAYTKA